MRKAEKGMYRESPDHEDHAAASYLELALEMAQASRRMVRVPDIHKITDLSTGESFVLGYLAEQNKPVNPKEISEAMNVSSARIATILNRLEEKGLVRREPDARDGRNTLVCLLPAGIVQQQKNEEEFNSHAIRFLKALGPEDAAEYVRLQKKIAKIYEK